MIRGIRDRVDCLVEPAVTEPSQFSTALFVVSIVCRRDDFLLADGAWSLAATNGMLATSISRNLAARVVLRRLREDWGEGPPFSSVSSGSTALLSLSPLQSARSALRGVHISDSVPEERGL